MPKWTQRVELSGLGDSICERGFCQFPMLNFFSETAFQEWLRLDGM